MEEGAVKLLTISDLLRLRRPHTGTSLNSAAHGLSVSDSASKPPPPPSFTDSNPNPNPRVLLPLSYPAILAGTLTLPPETLKCPNGSCFQFSDGSSTICCDILEFSILIIGKTIQVLAWNFVPIKHSAGGFLEIIKWKFSGSSGCALSRCSNIDSIPLASCASSPPGTNDKDRGRYSVHGSVDSVSPVSLVPCSFGTSNSCNLRGFIVRIMACECRLCNSKESVAVSHNLGLGQIPHSFTKPLFIYFIGSFSSWQPAILKIVGNVISLLGLKRKLVFIEKEESQLMFLTTSNSVLHLPRLDKKPSPTLVNVIAGRGELGAYTGTVSGMYMQGMVVELDSRVLLLLTDHHIAAPHSLRVGAVVLLRNVHFVNPKFTWTQMLILGSCFQTCITIKTFSPLETGIHVVSRSPSQLGKIIDSLTFSARLWALLVVSCFRTKFTSSLSVKEILGSKHKEGLAQMFIRSHINLSVVRARHGKLAEFCKHVSCSCGGELICGYLKLVAPISTFLHFSDSLWRREMLQNYDCQTECDKSQTSLLSSEVRSHSQSLRRMFHSQDIGFSLLGSLKISSASGRLQLVDATGSVDAIVPDLPSTWKSSTIYEVVNYCLIVEGKTDVDHQEFSGHESLSCRNIFRSIPWTAQANLTMYICFHLSEENSKNLPFYPRDSETYDYKKLRDNKFHLICISHKYPVLQKFHGVPVMNDRSTMMAEATILPWDLFLDGQDESMLRHMDSEDFFHGQSIEHPIKMNGEHQCHKKRKVDEVSCPGLVSDLMNDHSYSSSKETVSSSSCEGSADGRCENLSCLEIPCSATIRTTNGHSSLGLGKLRLTNSKLNITDYNRSGAQKVLLEFNSDNYLKYQLLQIGSYYIIMHHQEESLCTIENYKAACAKVAISSEMHMLNLYMCSEEEAAHSRTSPDASQDEFSLKCREDLVKDEGELLLRSKGNSPKSFSDVCLHLSANAMGFLEQKLKEIKETLFEAHVTPGQNFNDSREVCLATLSGFSSRSFDFSYLFPQGNLTTIQGYVVSIHSFNGKPPNYHLSCESFGENPQTRFFHENTRCSCIHVLTSNQMVCIFGSLSTHAYVVGFGPNVNATFHRVLELRGTNKFKLTPASYIVLNSIRIVDIPPVQKCSIIQPSLSTSSAALSNNVSFGMISEFQYRDCKPMQVTCRIVAVHVLVLEKNRRYNNLHPGVKNRQDLADIPVTGLVLDDGSSVCYCWANGERAATLLRLQEKLPAVTRKSSSKSTMFHVERLVKKHDKIIVRNIGCITDPFYQDLTVSVSSDGYLSISDENMLKSIVLNACSATLWSVIGNVMDSKTVGQLEKEHLIQMETTVSPKQNIYALEVRHVDMLTEARNTFQRLSDNRNLLPE